MGLRRGGEESVESVSGPLWVDSHHLGKFRSAVYDTVWRVFLKNRLARERLSVEKSLVSLMDEIRGRLELLECSLPKRVDAMAVSRISKLPYKVMFYREALIWRMTELGRTAFENFERDKLVSAIVLTRSAVETSAAIWYLRAKVASAVESDSVGDIDDYLMKVAVGIATDAPTTDDTTRVDFPRPVRVSAFLKQADKDIEGFSHQYGILSEYAHPNWAGTVLLYAKHDPENRRTDFGQNIRKGDNTKKIGVLNLSVALAMFEVSYNRITDLTPSFTTVCESGLQEGQDTKPTPK